MKKKRKMKTRGKIIIFIMILLLFLLPALFVTLLLKEFGSDTLDAKQLVDVKLRLNDNELVYTDETQMSFYVDLIKNADKIIEPARNLEEYAAGSLTMKKMSKTFLFTLYLSENPDDCLYMNAAGDYYRIDHANALSLLLMNETDFIYPNAALPKLTLTAGDASPSIMPTEYTWNYKIAGDGSRKLSGTNEINSETIAFSRQNPISASFSLEPDWLHISLYDTKNALAYDGELDDLSDFSPGADGYYVAELKAEWYDDATNTKRYYGSMNIKFNLFFDEPSVCSISSTSAYPGELVFLKLENAVNQNYTVRTDAQTSDTLQFVDYNNAKIAFIPISCDNSAGTKNISVTTTDGGTDFSFTVKVAEKEFNSLNLDATKRGCTAAQFVNANATANDVFAELEKTTSSQRLWEGVFTLPSSASDSWIDVRFGAMWNVLGTQSSIRNSGIEYAATKTGINVCASNTGTVVYSGSTELTGNMIVIDHGLGVKSIYYYLESSSVEVGTTVFKGQSIGKIGQTGYVGKPCLHFALSVNGTYINPYYFLNAGIPI